MFSEIGVVLEWFFYDVFTPFFSDFLVENKWAMFAFMLPICLSIIILFMMGILHISSLRMPQTRINNFINSPKFPVKIRKPNNDRMTERQTVTVDPNTGEIHMRKAYTKIRDLTRKERKSANDLMFDD